jgi:ATP-dependent exoDNAse (exonuclease V) beta subunit
MARAYDVRGLRAFARDMRANWEEAVRQVEGRPDAEEHAVSLITIHAAKGLEWPIVIPINMTGVPKTESGLMHDRRSGEFSVPVLGIEPAGYAAIASWNETELARERVRLWYVAATRARDLLVLPRHSAGLPDRSWANIIDTRIAVLPAIGPAELGPEMPPPAAPAENAQTGALFADEAWRISEAAITIQWHRPSLHDVEAPVAGPVPVFSDAEAAEEAIPVIEIAGSAARGTILHKLMEEALNGETRDTAAELERRAEELMVQLGREPSVDPKSGIAPTELAATIVRTLKLPGIVGLRPRLVPELTVFGGRSDASAEILVSGIADALAVEDTRGIEAIVDWKSDVDATPQMIERYRKQIDDYRKQTDAKRALIVMMTTGKAINGAMR